MAKLAILLAVFSLLALQEVTAFRTTVTTTVVEEDERMNPEQQQRCEEQIRRQSSLQSCQRYLSQQQQRSFYGLEMVVDAENPRQEERLSQCCSELRNVEEQCRCQAVSHAFRQQRQEGQQEREQEREQERQQERQQEREQERQQERQARQLAENLPSKCNLAPQRCQVESVWA